MTCAPLCRQPLARGLHEWTGEATEPGAWSPSHPIPPRHRACLWGVPQGQEGCAPRQQVGPWALWGTVVIGKMG